MADETWRNLTLEKKIAFFAKKHEFVADVNHEHTDGKTYKIPVQVTILESHDKDSGRSTYQAIATIRDSGGVFQAEGRNTIDVIKQSLSMLLDSQKTMDSWVASQATG